MTSLISYDKLPCFVKELAQRLQGVHIVLLKGSMGTGKTTLIKQLLVEYGVLVPSMSPTYAYVITYEALNKTIYHFDLYRLKSFKEFIALGFDEYFANPEALIIIEWPEVIEDFLYHYHNKYAIALDYHGTDQRSITEG